MKNIFFISGSKILQHIGVPVCHSCRSSTCGALTFFPYPFAAGLHFNKCSIVFFMCLLLHFSFPESSRAQLPETPAAEQQLESITENNGDAETEDDAYLQQMQYYIKHPLNLNTAGEDDLKELKILSPVQLQNFFSYRTMLGKFIDLYELQAVPGWSVELIQRIRFFITVNNEEKITQAVKNRLRNGEHSMLLRISQTLEKAKGYSIDSAANFYPGGPQKLLLRYKYQFKNLLQYGVLAEKDEGEQFFKGRQKQGFDFYSAHFFIRSAGIIKALALGDFAVNLGQGLTQWQSLAFKKSADALAVKREAGIIKPYNGAGEIFFHRGAAVTIQKNKLLFTGFVSYRSIDANFVTDSIPATADYVSSFQTSGYHRTKSEADDKGVQRQLAFGGNISYKLKGLRVGANAMQYKFKLPLQKDNSPHNLYALNGNALGNYSIDYSYTFKNCHFFGEAALSNTRHTAFINGLLISASQVADMSFLYRNISPGYQALYSNAFTESAAPANEKGFYAGLSIHPNGPWQLSAYADFYKFPWLRFSTNAPAGGTDFMVQLIYKPNRQLEIYTRYRAASKAVNYNPEGFIFSPVAAAVRKNLRTQLGYTMSAEVNIRTRVELVWFNTGNLQEQGFSGHTDVTYKPLLKNWAASARLQFFETESYNTRLYAYETDVLYSSAVPVFYGKGLRYFMLGSYDINKKTTIWLRWSQTIYSSKNSSASGLDAFPGNKKSAFKLQARYFF